MSRTKTEVEDEVLAQWLATCVKQDTRYAYKRAFELYQQYTGLDARSIVEEADEDLKKGKLERKNIVMTRLLGFYAWLQTEAPRVKIMGMNKRKVVGKGFGENSNSARNYLMGIRAFYTFYGFPIKLTGRSKIQKPSKKYQRHIFKSADIKKLVDLCRSPRDRVLILMAFQGGFDIDTLCRMTYSKVQDALSSTETPVRIDSYRAKEGVSYYTFISYDALDALKAYVKDMESRGVKFSPESPLFLKETYQKEPTALDTANAQQIMKDICERAGFGNGSSYNIYGFHAFRESFASIATENRIPNSVVDLWLGHTISEDMRSAYNRVDFEKVKQMYQSIELLLSVSGGSEKLKANEEEISDLKDRIEEERQAREALRTKNDILEGKLVKIEQGLGENKELIEDTILGMKMFIEAGALVTTNEDTKKLLKDLFSKVEKHKYPEA